MRRVFAVHWGLATLIYSASASAACERPRPAFQMPEGGTATEQDLQAAGSALIKLDQQVGEYLRCIQGEASQKSVGKDEAVRGKIAQEYVAAHDAAATELTGLGECFNAQLESFRKTGGGTEKKTVDCATFITAAANAPVRKNEPVVPAGLVKEADGHSFDIGDGAWSYTLIRDDRPRRCGEKSEQVCVERAVYVRSTSPQILECKAYIAYEGTDAAGQATTEAQAVVTEKGTRAVVVSLAPQGVSAKTFEAQCTARAALPALDTPATCKYEVVKPVTVSDYYPPEARRLGEEGPVVVEFTVDKKAANPSDVKVVGSSLSARLDQGAVNAVKAMVMSSNCSKGRYRLRLGFQLE